MPREPLKDALATPERKHRYVARLFDTIADDYDFITRLLSYGRDQHWKRRLIALAAIRPDERVLDLACGTGDLAVAAISSAHQDFSAAASLKGLPLSAAQGSPAVEAVGGDTDGVDLGSTASAGAAADAPHIVGLDFTPRSVELARAGQHAATTSPTGPASAGGNAPFVVGLDFTPRMVKLAHARERATTADASGRVDAAASAPARDGRRVRWLVGDMMALPFASGSFDVITTGYGFRNVPVLDEAIREAARVLRPGGRLFSLDFNRPQPALLRAAYLAYLTVVGSTVGLALHRDPDTYRYIPESIRRYPGAAAVVDRLRSGGFGEARWIPVLGGLMAIHVARK